MLPCTPDTSWSIVAAYSDGSGVCSSKIGPDALTGVARLRRSHWSRKTPRSGGLTDPVHIQSARCQTVCVMLVRASCLHRYYVWRWACTVLWVPVAFRLALSAAERDAHLVERLRPLRRI